MDKQTKRARERERKKEKERERERDRETLFGQSSTEAEDRRKKDCELGKS